MDKRIKEDVLNVREKKEADSLLVSVYRMDELKGWYKKRVSSDWLNWYW